MLQAADRRLYHPMYGFADSLNLNVASALTLQYLLLKFPHVRGQLEPEERQTLRETWYTKLAKSPDELRQYLANPPLPYQDVRRPDPFRAPWVEKKIIKRVAQREEDLRQAQASP